MTIAAPGGGHNPGILSLDVNNGYQYMSGTSMASPLIAGIVSLMVSLDPNLGYEKVKEYLKKSIHGNVMDVGLVNAHKGLQLILEPSAKAKADAKTKK